MNKGSKMFKVHRTHHSIPPGLRFRPSVAPENSDEVDFFGELSEKPQEFSEDNQRVFSEIVRGIQDLRMVVEIGVESRHNDATGTTQVFRDECPASCVYLGIDARNCSYLEDPGKRRFFLRADSRDIDAILDKIDYLDNGIDVLAINGHLSVERVLSAWQLVSRLRVGGYVLLQGTNAHPGPVSLLEAVDEEYLEVKRYCEESPDGGVAALRLRKALPTTPIRDTCFILQGPTAFAPDLESMIEPVADKSIWSTWTDNDESEHQLEALARLEARGMTIVRSIKPEEHLRGTGNANLQMVSTLAGLVEAQAQGYTHALRFRHDLRTGELEKFLSTIGDRIGFLCHYRWYLMDYIVSGPVDKLLLLFSGLFPQELTGEVCTEKFLKTRYVHWFYNETPQYLLPLMYRHDIQVDWLRSKPTTITPINKYYTDKRLRKSLSLPSAKQLR